MIHELKILPQYFDDVITHKKNFEVRFNDRNYQVGDTLLLREYTRGDYTGRNYQTKIIYILDDIDYLNPNYIILGLEINDIDIYRHTELQYYIEDVQHKILERITEEEDINTYDTWGSVLPPENNVTEESRKLRAIFVHAEEIAENALEGLQQYDTYWQCYWDNIDYEIDDYIKYH